MLKRKKWIEAALLTSLLFGVIIMTFWYFEGLRLDSLVIPLALIQFPILVVSILTWLVESDKKYLITTFVITCLVSACVATVYMFGLMWVIANVYWYIGLVSTFTYLTTILPLGLLLLLDSYRGFGKMFRPVSFGKVILQILVGIFIAALIIVVITLIAFPTGMYLDSISRY